MYPLHALQSEFPIDGSYTRPSTGVYWVSGYIMGGSTRSRRVLSNSSLISSKPLRRGAVQWNQKSCRA